MRYLCLVYGAEDSLPVTQNPNPMSRAEVDALTRDSLAYNDMLRTSGHFIVAHALQSVRTANTVRVRGGKVLVTDGPFAETKERLLGFVLIEAKDHYGGLQNPAGAPRQHRSAPNHGSGEIGKPGLAVGSQLRVRSSYLGLAPICGSRLRACCVKRCLSNFSSRRG